MEKQSLPHRINVALLGPDPVGIDWIVLSAFVWEQDSVNLFYEGAHVDNGRCMLSTKVTLLEGTKKAHQLKLTQNGLGVRHKGGIIPLWGFL